MQVTVAESGPCRRTLSIKLTADNVQSHISEAYRNAANQVELKGFRKGKVPRSVLEQRFGDEILAEAKESLINRTFEEALQQQELRPLGRPELDGIDAKPLDPESPLEFQVHFDIRPEFEVGKVKGIEVPRGESEVTDEDVESALQSLADEKRTLKPVEGEVEDGDFVKMDLAFKNEAGETVTERKGTQLNTRIPIAGADPEAFAAKLRGATVGQTLEIELTFPDNFEREEVRGQSGTAAMTVLDVLRITPAAIDDELAKSFDFESLAALREKLRERIAEEKVNANKSRQEEAIFDILANEHPFDLPANMVEDQTKHSLHEFEERLKKAGMAEEEIATKIEQSREEARADAERRVRVFFLLEAIARKEKIFVTEGDIDVELRQIAAQNNASLADVQQHYQEHKLLGDLRLALMERKVRDFLRDNAKLTD